MPNVSRFTPAVLTGLCLASLPAAAQIPGYAPPPGYTASALGIEASVFAVGPDGKFAVGTDKTGGGAGITVYSQIGPGRTVLSTFNAPAGSAFEYFGGIAWKDANTLAFSENGMSRTVFSASLASGTVTALAPNSSLPNAADIAYKPGDAGGTLYVGLAGGPFAAQKNAVYTVSGGTVQPFATGLGNGYLGGLTFRAGDGTLFVGDSNDPNIMGNAGQILKLNANGSLAETFSLAGGNGSGLAGLAGDSAGDLFASTGATLTELPAGSTAAQPFGDISGGFVFPTGLQFVGGDFRPFGGGTGTLIVNGGDTGANSLFVIRPLAAVPEPSALLILTIGAGTILLRRRLHRTGKKTSCAIQ